MGKSNLKNELFEQRLRDRIHNFIKEKIKKSDDVVVNKLFILSNQY